jgi:hypothetical protein
MHDSHNPDFALPFAEAHWVDVVPRSAACPQLASTVLLHAGPPFRAAPPAPVINAAVQAIRFEDLAADAAAARDLIAQGGVQLLPAQEHRIATPLAQVVSASMLLLAVEQQRETCFAPIIEGAAPALRFGSLAPESLQRLRDVGAWVACSVAPLLRETPVAIAGLIKAAVAGGDDCHARTSVANEALISNLHGLGAVEAQRLKAMPAFVLPLLMAAAGAALRARRCEIDAIGGNGLDFGVRWRGERAWRQLRAEAPCGSRCAGTGAEVAMGAIGDSALIDFCGLGGQADALARRAGLIDPETGIVDARRVSRSGLAPLINLAIIDRDGAAGLIGRGVYCPPVELFLARPAL